MTSISEWTASLNAMAGTSLSNKGQGITRGAVSLWGSAEDVRRLREAIASVGSMAVARFDDSAARDARGMCIISVTVA